MRMRIRRAISRKKDNELVRKGKRVEGWANGTIM